MTKSLLFIPDISGFTHFVQTTEVEHSQHVIAELLEVLISANTQDLKLAEIEGDALFFYKENAIPSQEKLLAQVESMYTAFYSHLKLLEKNRICPCNACATAINLQLKIVVHSGELQFINVQDNRKPFGENVIKAHRLLKNSVPSDNYVLFSAAISEEIGLTAQYESRLFSFSEGRGKYDGRFISYIYSEIDTNLLMLSQFPSAETKEFNCAPNLEFNREISLEASKLIELITNYSTRHHWAKGADKVEWNENEVTRLGSEHVCTVGEKQLNFKVITKNGAPDEFVYGELTTSPSPVDELSQFFIIKPLSNGKSSLRIELYWKAMSPIKKLIMALLGKKAFKKEMNTTLKSLEDYIASLTA